MQTKTIQFNGNMQTETIQFKGKTSEYFGIWISNLVLSIITFSIYSAWAKVRRETYFKNATSIFGDSFQYHATGGQILKGRLIFYGFFVLLNSVVRISPNSAIVVSLMFLALLPWIINSSLRFKSRMTSYRNIRFNWHGTYLKTLWYYTIAPLAGLLSFGILLPWMFKAQYAYFANSSAYGTTRFKSGDMKLSKFYSAWMIYVFLPTIVVFIAIGVPVAIGFSDDPASYELFSLLFILGLSLHLSWSGMVLFTISRNLLLDCLELSGQVRFASDLNPLKYAWIYVTNACLIVVTLGFMLPWAKIRMYRYLASKIDVKLIGNLDEFVDTEKRNVSAFSEGYADMEGLDIGI